MKCKTCLFLVLIIFMPCFAISAQDGKSTYLSEINALCDAFNPETWSVDVKTLSPAQLAEMLVEKIQSAIHSDKMKKIFQTLRHDRTKSAYSNYAKNVSALIGEPYTCNAMKDYFSVSFN